jgi:hypothetical protein
MEEILGWYGLQTTTAPTTPDDVDAAVPAKLAAAQSQAASFGSNVEHDESVGDTSYSAAVGNGNNNGNGTSTACSGSVQRRGRSNEDELPLDLTSANAVIMRELIVRGLY